MKACLARLLVLSVVFAAGARAGGPSPSARPAAVAAAAPAAPREACP